MGVTTNKISFTRGVKLAPSIVLWAAVSWMAASSHVFAAEHRVAVFPFELLDASQDDELIPKVKPEETKRLQLLTDDLKARLEANANFKLESLEEITSDVKAAAPLFKCNGCEGDLAKKTGADIAMLGLVQKFSDTLLSVSIEVVDAKSGKVTGSYSAGVQGNTDDAWLHALRHIVKNKIVVEGPNVGTPAP